MSKNEGLTKDKHTISEHRIKTADGLHTLYVQEWGNPKGVPILFLHGGPGGGCYDGHKDNFDAKKHYVVFFDQRGAGKSKPKGSRKNNTTQKLIEDIELIRGKLGLKKFLVHGGSWGSTLALCYGIAFPKNVSGMILRGIFLGTDEEREWFEKPGYSRFFPDIMNFYTEGVPKQYLNKPGVYHRKQILEKNSKKSAYQYAEIESQVLKLDHRFKPAVYKDYDTSYAKIISYYMDNSCFLKPNYILANAKKLTMPIYIIHGRYDMVCLPKAAYALDKALPNSKLYWTIAGHAGSDRSSYDVAKTLVDLVL